MTVVYIVINFYFKLVYRNSVSTNPVRGGAVLQFRGSFSTLAQWTVSSSKIMDVNFGMGTTLPTTEHAKPLVVSFE